MSTFDWDLHGLNWIGCKY